MKLGHFPIFGMKFWSEIINITKNLGIHIRRRELSGMASFYEIDSILSNLEKDEYFVDFLNTKSLEAGIIRLRKDQKDTQTNHPLERTLLRRQRRRIHSYRRKKSTSKSGDDNFYCGD